MMEAFEDHRLKSVPHHRIISYRARWHRLQPVKAYLIDGDLQINSRTKIGDELVYGLGAHIRVLPMAYRHSAGFRLTIADD